MTDQQLRVVVLGHPGEAQQQLCHALDELGARTLAVGDFNQLDPAQMREQQPDVWLVSVDESTDAALLEPWQPLFDDPDATVVFDDADVTRRLTGWDLARWARHLVAKVLGRDDVLPPVREGAERLPQSSAPVAAGNAQVESHEHVELSLVDDTDIATSAGDPASAHVVADNTQFASLEHSGLSLVDDADVATFASDAAPAHVVADNTQFASLEHSGLSLVDDADFAALSASFDAERNQSDAGRADAEPAMALDDLLRAQSGDAAETSSAAVAGNTTAVEKTGPAAQAGSDAASGFSLMDMDADHSAPRMAAAAKHEVNFDIGGLSLESLDGEEAAAPPASAQASGPVKAPAAAASAPAKGLIAIIAGLGGPDAVRQFLAALPADLPVPVLLWQHLDAGKHDRLAQQLGKASRLPVYLAKAGEPAQPGAVGVVSTGLVMTDDDGMRFAVGSGGASDGLTPALNDPATVIVVLSGAEAGIVGPAQTHNAHGGKVLVQTPMTCFDSTAASALDGAGMVVALPAELAGFAAAGWVA